MTIESAGKKPKKKYETVVDPKTGKPVVNPKTGKPVKAVVKY